MNSLPAQTRESRRDQILVFFCRNIGISFATGDMHARFGTAFRTRVSELNRNPACPITIYNCTERSPVAGRSAATGRSGILHRGPYSLGSCATRRQKGIETMADDARISTALPRHPKTVKVERRLGAQGCWSLIKLFLWVAENRPIGDLAGMSGEDIGIAAEWPGDTGEFVRTLAEVRFLDGEEGSYQIHDWAEHNPWAATRPQRTEAAKKAAAARWKSKQAAVEPDAQRMRPACDPHETAMPSSPLLSSPPDTTKSKACARPTLEQVAAYCREHGNSVNPQHWFDFYTSNGWKVGRNPMRDWKAAVRTWERNGVNYANGSQPSKARQIAQSNIGAMLANRDRKAAAPGGTGVQQASGAGGDRALGNLALKAAS